MDKKCLRRESPTNRGAGDEREPRLFAPVTSQSEPGGDILGAVSYARTSESAEWSIRATDYGIEPRDLDMTLPFLGRVLFRVKLYSILKHIKSTPFDVCTSLVRYTGTEHKVPHKGKRTELIGTVCVKVHEIGI